MGNVKAKEIKQPSPVSKKSHYKGVKKKAVVSFQDVDHSKVDEITSSNSHAEETPSLEPSNNHLPDPRHSWPVFGNVKEKLKLFEDPKTISQIQTESRERARTESKGTNQNLTSQDPPITKSG